MAAPDQHSPQGFLGNILKYSIATYLGFGISGLALIVSGVLGPEKTAAPLTFISATATLMNIGILGLDQSLLRFYAEPPAGRTGRQLFGFCLTISALVMTAAGLFFSLVCPDWLAGILSFQAMGSGVVPLLFLNAFFYMWVRYLNVLLRLEGKVGLYTLETLLMQGCYNLFYLVAGFFTSDPYAFALVSVLSFGGVALVFGLRYRGVFREGRQAFTKPVAKQILPYGLALAPTQIMLYLNNTFSLAFLGNSLGTTVQGTFAFGVRLSQLVTTIQAGFSTFWGPFVYANYRDQQELIAKVQDYLCLLIFSFYCCLVAAEDILFFIFPAYQGCLPVFPVLMMSPVFTILCEGTVYGISIARRPIFDTMGIAISALGNIGLCVLLVPKMGLMGASLALAVSAGGMFLFRTIMGQYYYRTILHPLRTIAGFVLAIGVAAAGVFFWDRFLLKGVLCLVALVLYLILYREQLKEAAGFLGQLTQARKSS